VALALKENSSLTTLRLDGNEFGKVGTREVALALLENINLTDLDLKENGMDSSSAVFVKALLERNNRLAQAAEEAHGAMAESQPAETGNATRLPAKKLKERTRDELADEEALRDAQGNMEAARLLLDRWGAACGPAGPLADERLEEARALLAELVAAHTAYASCQMAVVTATDDALDQATAERDFQQERFIQAAAVAGDAVEVLFRYNALVNQQSTSLAITLDKLERAAAAHCPAASLMTPAVSHQAATPEDEKRQLEELLEQLQRTGSDARVAKLQRWRAAMEKVEKWPDMSLADPNEEEQRRCELEATWRLLEDVRKQTVALNTSMASALRSAIRQCSTRLEELQSEQARIQEERRRARALLDNATELKLCQCPDKMALGKAELEEARALKKWRFANVHLELAQLKLEMAEEEGGEAAAKAMAKIERRKAAAASARLVRRRAAARVHEEAVVLLQVSRHYPELLRCSSRLEELQAAPTLVQGRCLEDYTVVDTLAAGEDGRRHQVLLCSRPVEDEDGFAVVCVLKRYLLADSEGRGKRRLLRELRLLEQARHPFVAAAQAVFFSADASEAYVELEHFGGGDLGQWLAKKQRGDAEVRRLLGQALLGIAAMHRAGVVHGDVKPANLFVDEEGGRCVVGDFDLTRSSAPAASMTVTRLAGTEAYLAPELLANPGTRATAASDVFSFGLVLFDVLFPAREGAAARRPSAYGILSKSTAVAIPSHPDDSLRALLQSMLSLAPAHRPTADAVASHPYFADAAHNGSEGEDRLWGAERDCCIGAYCADVESLTLADGLECGAGEHFVCRADLEAWVAAFCSSDNGRRQTDAGGELACSASSCAAIFSTHRLAQHISPASFGQVMDMIRHVVEQAVSREQEQLFRARLEGEVARMAQEGTVGIHSRKILEEILLLRCPRCQAAFDGFTGCFALSCNNCPCNFCASCLKDCGPDAHQHVARCPEKPNPGVFGDAAEFEEGQRRRRTRLVEAYLADLPHDTRGAVRTTVAPHLAELGIQLAA